MKKSILIAAAALVAVGFPPNNTYAETLNWTGAAALPADNTDWGEGANWDKADGTVPNGLDDAIISGAAGGVNIYSGQTKSLVSVTVQSGSIVNITGTLMSSLNIAGGTLNVTGGTLIGQANVNAGGALSFTGGTLIGQANINAGGTISFAGTGAINGGLAVNSGVVQLDGASGTQFNINGSATFTDTTINVGISAGNVCDTIHAAGTLSFAGANIVNLNQWLDGSYLLGSGMLNPASLPALNALQVKVGAGTTNYFNSETTRRVTRLSAPDLAANKLTLLLTSGNNARITWSGATSPAWTDAGNWTNGLVPADPDYIDTFLAGDVVTFDGSDNPAVSGRVISGSGIRIAAMFVSGTADYVFNADITAGGASTLSGIAEFGRLVKTGTGKLTLNGNNNFVRGAMLSGGTVVLGNDKALGTATGTTGQGEVRVTGDTVVQAQENRSISNRFVVNNNAKLTLDIASGKTLEIHGVDNGAVGVLSGELKAAGGGILELNNNTNAAGDGGAIWYDGGALDLSPLAAVKAAGNSSGGAGGAFWILGNLTTGNNAEFSNNTATDNGGAIYAGGDVTLGNAAKFSGNESAGIFGGGAIAAMMGDVTLGTGALFENNNATAGDGGAIFTAAGNIDIGDAAKFTGNEAAGAFGGGAIAAWYGAVNLGANVEFSGNNALAGLGGAIIAGTDADIGDNSKFTGNTAAGDGGAIYAFANVNTGAGAIVSGNTAGENGGAILALETITIGDSSVFSGNTAGNSAPGSGGALFAYGDVGTVITVGNAVTFSQNSAADGGGAIFANGNILIGDDAQFLNNNGNAGNGGGIWGKANIALGDGTVITGNTALKSGAGIFAENGSVTLGDDAVISGNNTTTGTALSFSGTAIYAQQDVTLGDDAVITGNNAAGGAGGALLAYNGNILIGKNATISGNASAAGSGGALYSHNGSVALGTGARVTGNNATGGSGGAINAKTGVSIAGDTVFSGNTATNNGGAIYLDSGTATLTADIGDIIFTGNTAGGNANSIYLNFGVTLTLAGANNIYFDDPINAGATGGNSLAKNDAGVVQFQGANVLNSAAGGAIGINAGQFRLAGTGTSFTSAGSAFTLASGATLGGSGAITAASFTLAGVVAPDAEIFSSGNNTVTAANKIGLLSLAGNVALNAATLEIDLDKTAAQTSDRVAVTGTVTFDTASKVALNNWEDGTFTIATATGIAGADATALAVNYGGQNYNFKNAAGIPANIRKRATLEIAGTALNLTLASSNNVVLAWTGLNNAVWHGTDTGLPAGTGNWTNKSAVSLATTFLDGDAVVFDTVTDNINAGNRSILVGSDVVVESMTVDGSANYTFSGSGINATIDPTKTTLTATPTGMLFKSGAGTLTLNNANEFEGGIALAGGTLVLGNDKALGTYAPAIAGLVGTAGEVYVLDDTVVQTLADRTISNRFESYAELTLDIATGTTLTISGVDYTAGISTWGGAIDVYYGSLKIAGTGGNLVFENNAGYWGGAINADSADIDLQALASVTATGNSATDFGGAIYTDGNVLIGNAANFSDNTAQLGGAIVAGGDFTLGNNAVFARNSATLYDGGAIFAGGLVTIGDNAEFTGNNAFAHAGATASQTGSVVIGNNAVFRSNTSGDLGGAIFALQNVSVGDNAVFENNAADAGGASSAIHGGAIYASDGTVNIGNNAVLRGNIAESAGGAVYAGSSSVTIGDSAVISGNTARNAGGGAIFANQDITAGTGAKVRGNSAVNGGALYTYYGSVTVGTGARFAGNSATMDGGAINAGNGVNIAGDTVFRGNTADNNGGAIYIHSGTAMLNADIGNIRFRDNFAAGIANAIYLAGTAALNLTGANNIYFDDPVTSAGTSNLTKTGTGIAQFQGDNVLGGVIDIQAGQFRLANNASISGTNFNLAKNAALAGSGTITADADIRGTVALDNKVFTPANNNVGNKNIGTLTLAGNATVTGAMLQIDLAAGNICDTIDATGYNFIFSGTNNKLEIESFEAGRYVLVSGNMTYANANTLRNKMTIAGQSYAAFNNTRQTAELIQNTDSLVLDLKQGQNVVLTWTGATDAVWEGVDAGTGIGNWTNKNSVSPLTTFLNGDSIYFDSNTDAGAPANRTITIGGTRVKVAQMTVSGAADYTFSGGRILADGTTGTTLTDPAEITGKLTKRGSGILTLNNSNEFAGGIELAGGTIVLGHNKALGTYTGVPGAGEVTVTGNAKIATAAPENRRIANRFVVDAGKTLTLESGTGATLTLGAVPGDTLVFADNSTLKLSGDGNFFFEGVTYGNTGNVLVKNGTGIAQIGATGMTLNNAAGGEVNIAKGTFRLTDFGVLNSPDSPVTLGKNATLAGTGLININTATATLAGTIAPDGDVFTATHTTVSAGKRIGQLLFTGGVNFNKATYAVDLAAGGQSDFINADTAIFTGGLVDVSEFRTGDYLIFGTSAGLTDWETLDLCVAGEDLAAIANIRKSAKLDGSDGQNLYLRIADNNSVVLWWTGANGNVWDTAQADWTNKVAGIHNVDTYAKGDIVHFDGTADSAQPGNRTITVAGNVSVADMFVEGNADYTFDGPGKITADAALWKYAYDPATMPVTPSGKLTKTGTGTLTFNNANEFTGGIMLNQGTVVLGHNKALGTYVGTAAGEVTVTGTSTVKTLADRSIQNHFTVTGDKTLTLDIAAGTTLTIHDMTYSGTGAAIDAIAGKLAIAPGSGSLVLRDNVATSYAGGIEGGNETIDLRNLESFKAIRNSGTYGGALDTNGNVVLGSNATFRENSATTFSGGAIYGGKVTIGENAVFADNEAYDSGGAIYATGDVSISGNTKFSGNLAGDSGGAIYASGNVSLNADAGDIVFSGNTDSSGNNAIRLGGSGTKLTLAGDNNIYFDDSVSGNSTSLVKTGTGIAQFQGANMLGGDADIKAGVLRLAGGASIHVANFTLRNAAELGGTGAIDATGDVTLAGVISLDAETFSSGKNTVKPANALGVLDIKTAGGTAYFNATTLKVDLQPGGASDIVYVTGGTAEFTGKGVITTDAPLPAGDWIYTLVVASDGLNIAKAHTVLVAGEDLSTFSNIRESATTHIDDPYSGASTGNGNVLYLHTKTDNNVVLTWTGAKNNNWNFNAPNWDNGVAGIHNADTFIEGDIVVFENMPGGKVNIRTAVSPAEIRVNSDSDYVFQGTGTINLGGAPTTLAADGILHKDGTGKLTIKNGDLSNQNSFAAGFDIRAGTVSLAYDYDTTLDFPVTGKAAGTLEKAGTGILTLTADLEPQGFNGTLHVAEGVLSLANNQTVKLVTGAAPGVIELNGNTLTTDGNRRGTFSGQMLGNGTFVKAGTGIYTLDGIANGTNVLAGNIDVAGGVLRVRNINGCDTATPKNIALCGGWLDLSDLAGWTGSYDDNTHNDWCGINLIDNCAGIGGVIGKNDCVVVYNDASYAIGATKPGVYVVIDALNANNCGTGTVCLTGSNTYLGSTHLASGTLMLSANTQIGEETYAREVVFTGGDLCVTASVDTLGRALEMRTDGAIDVLAGATTTWSTVTNGGTLGGTDACLTKTGDGTLVLTNAVDHSGTICADTGLIQFLDTTTLGALVVEANGAADLNGTGNTLTDATIAGIANINGNTTVINPIVVESTAATTLADGITLALQNGGTIRADIAGTAGTLHNQAGTLDMTANLSGHLINAGTASIAGNIGGNATNTGMLTQVGSIVGFLDNADAAAFADITGDVGSIAQNLGTVELTGNVLANANNTGALTVAGTVNGTLTNNAGGTVASVGAVVGEVRNYGLVERIGTMNGDVYNYTGARYNLPTDMNPCAINGRLFNSGLVYFGAAGQKLRVNELHNADSGAGYYNVEIDLKTPANSDQIEVAAGGAITGKHVFLVRNILNPDHAQPKQEIPLVIGGDLQTTDITATLENGAPVDAGLYRYTIKIESSATVVLAATQYSAAGQAIANTAGAMSIGWFAQLDNLTKRMGEIRLANAYNCNGPQAKRNTDLWVRGYGQQVNADLGIAGMKGFREYDYGADVGADRGFVLDEKSMLYIGAYAGYQGAKRHMHDGFGSTGDTDSVYAGLYATYVHENGFYVDAVAKGQYFENSYELPSDKGKTDNYGAGLSLEIGKQWKSTGGWFIEPSVQAAYTHIFSETYNTAAGVRVNGSDSDIWRFRGTFRFGKTCDAGTWGTLQPYAKIGIEEQVSLGGAVRAGVEGLSRRFTPNTDGTRVFGGVGLMWQLDQAQQIHFDYEGSFGDKYDMPWSINVGYRVMW